MNKKKLVLPGDHILSCEEAVPGGNTYTENDEIFAATYGESSVAEGTATVKGSKEPLVRPYVGMELYCMVTKTSPNKAIAACIPISEAEKKGSVAEMTAVLPVTALGKRGYVEDLRNEVKIGDILRAQIKKIMKTGIDITIAPPDCGFVCAFCPRCRNVMDLKDHIFICTACKWKERRKIPGGKEE